MSASPLPRGRGVLPGTRPRAWTTLALRCLGLMAFASSARGDALPEYRIKAAFLYNFALFTEWPAEVGGTLNLCVAGPDPFAAELDPLQGKTVGGRTLAVLRKASGAALADCQIVFVPAAAGGTLPHVLDSLRGRPVLTVAESAGAARQGAALNLAVEQSKVSFEANLQAARSAGLNLSSKLLRLATEVIQ